MTRRNYLFLSLLLILISCARHTEPIHPLCNTEAFIVWSDDLSNQQVSCFGEDGFGYVWIGTWRGVNKYNGYQFLQHYHSDDSCSLSNNQIQKIFSDSRHRLWVTTRFGINRLNEKGIFKRIPVESESQNVVNIAETENGRIFINTVNDICEYDPDAERFVRRINLRSDNKFAYAGFYIDKASRIWCVSFSAVYCFDSSSFEMLASYPIDGLIHSSYLRSNGELWLCVGDKLMIMDIKSGNMVPTPAAYRNHPVLSKSMISLIHPYNDVSLLLNTQKDGIFLLNVYTGEVIHQSENGFPFNAPDMEITVMFTDSAKNLWIGSYDQGFKVIYNFSQRFNTNDYLRSHTENKSVMAVTTDKDQNLWIATRMHGLMVYEHQTQEVKNIDTQKLLLDEFSFKNRINGIFVDSRNNIWLQTYYKLIKCRYRNGALVPEKIYWTDAIINVMAEDFEGTIWAAGTGNKIYFLNEGGEVFQPLPIYPEGYHFTNGLLTLSSGKLLIASFQQNLRLFDPATKTLEEVPIVHLMGGSVFVPSALFEDSEGYIWLATIGNGLFRIDQQNRKIEEMKDIACKEICSVTEDVQGNIWLGTLYGLFKYDRTVNRFTVYYASDGTGGNQYNERCAAILPDNSLVFGGTHGLTLFDPIDVSIRRRIPLYIEELKIHNRRLIPETGGKIETAMLLNPEVRLAHDENSLQFAYAALDYSEFPHVQYAYKLDGFDNQWVEARNVRQAFYSNLPAGKYTFQVKITSHDNSITETATSVPVYIARAPWLSIPALCFYSLLLLCFIWLIFYMYNRNLDSRRRAQLALQEKEHEQYINRMNMNFFANISHEFRTPLTMISGPVSTLCHDESIQEENKRLLFIVQRSVRRMLRLVNQILDFNKLENDAIRLKVQYTDSIHVLNRIIDIFRPNIKEKGIALNLYGFEDSFNSWIDTDKLEKIAVNLISNALKFSSENAIIEISYDVISSEAAKQLSGKMLNSVDSNYIKVVVADTGPGIPPDKLEDIFQRYYQLERLQPAHLTWGTGIGLYFARRLAEMHHGCLFAGNRKDGRSGAVFTLLLPTNEVLYPDSEKEKTKTQQSFVIPESEKEVMTAIGSAPQSEDAIPTLLVVDDDTEISRYLRELLSTSYRVINRYNVDSAWKVIDEEPPDMIVSDVIMPGVDGYAFCRQIKENLSTSHIPVILLTAKVSMNEQVEGLNVGANAYVTKPFDPAYLLALIKSQLRNRDNLRQQLSDTTQTTTLPDELLSSQDKTFMDNLYDLMEKELSNPELNITRMTEVLRISRTKFYYKVKGLTGENPNIFFKTYKLNRAAELIKEGKYNMSEIADMAGFSTPSHFSSSFKKKFGISPSEYK